MSSLGHDESRTAGNGGFLSGCQAQWSRLSGSYHSFDRPSEAGIAAGGHDAPSRIQRVRRVDLFVRQRFSFLGHPLFRVLVVYPLEQKLAAGLPWDDGRPAVPAGE